MSARTYNPGDEVYDIHGRAGSYVARVAGGHIVQPIVEHEDDEGQYLDDAQTWAQIFPSPPTEKLHAEVAALEKQANEARAELNAIQSQVWKLNSEEKARADRIKQHEALADLDRYLAGEITHYVATHDYYPVVEIIPVGETIESYQSDSGYGLLTLYPSRNWDRKTRFSVYYKKPSPDYSATKTVLLCCGEAEANAKAAGHMRLLVAHYEAKPPAQRSYFDQLLTSCARFGVEVPQRMRDEQAALKVAQLQAQLQKAHSSVADIETAIALAQGGAA